MSSLPHRPSPLALTLAGASLPWLLAGCHERTVGEGDSRLPEQPPVILISLDTLRQDHVGLYGYDEDTTPVMDALAEECVVFEQAYTTMSWTLIAHMSMLTGLYPSQHRVWDKDSALPASIPTLAERLKDEGYYTMGFYFGPTSWVDPRFGYDRGFDVYMPHADAEEADRNMAKVVAERPKDKPLFLFLHLFDIHSAPIRKNKDGDIMYRPPSPFDQCFMEDAKGRLMHLDHYKLWNEDAREVTPEEHEAIVALYDSGIRYIDHKLGEWIADWREEGFFDDAITIITSDHGEGLRQRGGNYGGHGGTAQEGLLVPLLIRFPKAQFGGTRVEEPVSHVDLLPTILDYLRLDHDPRLVGYSLLESVPADRLIIAERAEMEAYIQWPWKIIQGRGEKTGRALNLEEDPGEWKAIRANRDRKRFLEIAEPVREVVSKEQERWFYPDDPNPMAGRMSDEDRAIMEAAGYAGEVDEE